MWKKKPVLRLTENHVMAGMIVKLCLDGKKEPEKDDDGEMVMVALMGGGHYNFPYFYPLAGGIEKIEKDIEVPVNHSDPHGPKKIVKGEAILAHSMTGFNPNVRFQPINVYTPEDAPGNEHYIAYVNNEILPEKGKKSCRRDALYLYKDEKGIFHKGHCSCERGKEWCKNGQVISLPKGALLASLDEWQKHLGKKEKAA